MRSTTLSAFAAAAILTLATPVAAQTPEGVMGELLADLSMVEKKTDRSRQRDAGVRPRVAAGKGVTLDQRNADAHCG